MQCNVMTSRPSLGSYFPKNSTSMHIVSHRCRNHSISDSALRVQASHVSSNVMYRLKFLSEMQHREVQVASIAHSNALSTEEGYSRWPQHAQTVRRGTIKVIEMFAPGQICSWQTIHLALKAPSLRGVVATRSMGTARKQESEVAFSEGVIHLGLFSARGRCNGANALSTLCSGRFISVHANLSGLRASHLLHWALVSRRLLPPAALFRLVRATLQSLLPYSSTDLLVPTRSARLLQAPGRPKRAG